MLHPHPIATQKVPREGLVLDLSLCLQAQEPVAMAPVMTEHVCNVAGLQGEELEV